MGRGAAGGERGPHTHEGMHLRTELLHNRGQENTKSKSTPNSHVPHPPLKRDTTTVTQQCRRFFFKPSGFTFRVKRIVSHASLPRHPSHSPRVPPPRPPPRVPHTTHSQSSVIQRMTRTQQKIHTNRPSLPFTAQTLVLPRAAASSVQSRLNHLSPIRIMFLLKSRAVSNAHPRECSYRTMWYQTESTFASVLASRADTCSLGGEHSVQYTVEKEQKPHTHTNPIDTLESPTNEVIHSLIEIKRLFLLLFLTGGQQNGKTERAEAA